MKVSEDVQCLIFQYCSTHDLFVSVSCVRRTWEGEFF